MKLFMDTANLDEIKKAVSWGLVDGVTTNPTSVSKEGVDFKTRIVEICEAVDGPVSAEVISLEADKMIAEAKDVAGWHKNVVVKIPCTTDGLKAAKELEKQGIKTNVTLVFSANQVLAACKVGATYISPFVGRLDRAGQNGMDMIAESLQIVENYDFDSQLIVASLHDPITIKQSAILGAHICTASFKVFEQLTKHPFTDAGIKSFLADWEKMNQNG